MAKKLQLEIVTPEGRVYSHAIDHVVLPGSEGEMEVFPDHAPYFVALKPGGLKVTDGAEVKDLAIGEGFAEITGTHVTVLTDAALTIDQIDEKTVQEALERAQNALKEKVTAEDKAEAMLAISRSMAQLNLKKRHTR
jgi:F-type H+-transporting ATPase subunit epsilon